MGSRARVASSSRPLASVVTRRSFSDRYSRQEFAHRGVVVERDDVRLPMRVGLHDNASIDETDHASAISNSVMPANRFGMRTAEARRAQCSHLNKRP